MSFFKDLFKKFNKKPSKTNNVEPKKYAFESFNDIEFNQSADIRISDIEQKVKAAEQEKLDLILADVKRKKALDIANIADETRKTYKKAFAYYQTHGIDSYIKANNTRSGIGRLQSALSKIDKEKYKHDIEKLKNAKKKKRWRKANYSDSKLSSICRSLDRIQNEKLQNGYRMMFCAGVRTKTLGGLEKRDIELKDGKIFVKVRADNNKSRKKHTIEALEDEKLYKYLENRLKELNDYDKVFYAGKTYQNNATKLCFNSHLLRAASAQIELYTNGKSMDEVKEKLGHSEFTDTERYYIKSKNINFYKTKYNNFNKKRSGKDGKRKDRQRNRRRDR